MKRLAVSGLGIGIIAAVLLSGTTMTGFTVNSVNGVGSVEAGSGLVDLAAALITVVALLVAAEPEGLRPSRDEASTSRRAAAWFIDFWLSLLAASSVLALIPLTAEALATGHFQWHFVRNDIHAVDWLLSLVIVGLAFLGMGIYWAFPVPRGGQTIGQSMFGLVVVSRSAESPRFSRALLRGLLQPFAMLLWLGKLISQRKTFWHDDIAGVTVFTTRGEGAAA